VTCLHHRLTVLCSRHGDRWGVGMYTATIPSAIKIIPLAKRVIAWKTLFDLAASPSFPPRQPNTEFVKNPSRTKAIPNVRICARAEPALGSTNCGRNANKNRDVFGFSARNPCRISERFAGCCRPSFPSIGLVTRVPLPISVVGHPSQWNRVRSRFLIANPINVIVGQTIFRSWDTQCVKFSWREESVGYHRS
jgi:hypothetical protein